MKYTIPDIEKVIEKFNTVNECIACSPYGKGHINDTYLVLCKNYDGSDHKYILQALNINVFKNPEAVMDNIEKVTRHLRSKALSDREVLSLVKTRSGKNYFITDDDKFCRMYEYVSDSICLEKPGNLEDFKQCAVAFGKFQKDLSDFPAETLNETIPDFHNTPERYKNLLKAVSEDKCGRAGNVQKEIQFAKDRESFYSTLIDCNKQGKLPLRVSHNDTKINNVMLDVKTHKALCVIDLDTIMPGFSVTDFGDSIRFGASTAAEDEKDLSKVNFDMNLFKAYTDGFLEGCGGKLPDEEIMLLPEGAKMMTVECGMRFLTDYLEGDTYFKTAYPEHNLDRCRTQFKLVSEMEKYWDEMKAAVREYCSEK